MPRPRLSSESETVRVQVRLPEGLLSLVNAWLAPGENLSSLVRRLLASEVGKRLAERDLRD